MTVTELDLDIDLSMLVGPMEDVACEHSTHNVDKRFHDDGPATHYIRTQNECCKGTLVYPSCSRWATYIRSGRGNFHCYYCHTPMPPENVTVIGPVNG